MDGRLIMTLLVDTRWKGKHGIGRYSAEVIKRLRLPWEAIPGDDPLSIISSFRRLRDSKGRSPDIIYTPGFNAFATQTPQLITIHDLIHLTATGPRQVVYRAYYNDFLRPIVRRNRRVLTVSETSRAALDSWLHDDRVEIINTGNGCSEAFNPEGPRYSPGFPYVLYVGNLKPHKNFPVIAKALAAVPDLHLVVVTSDSMKLDSLTSRLGIQKRTKQFQTISDEQLAEIYRGANWTVMPSLLEGFGLPALESISCGTPVIYWSGCQSVAEIVGSNGIGVTSATDNYEWIDAMRTSPVGVAGLSKTQSTWQKVAEKVNTAITSSR
jgi:glycosyltransferase involved in cell wall biosynthesis